MVLTTLLDFEVFLSGVILQVTKKVYPIASQGSHGWFKWRLSKIILRIKIESNCSTPNL